MLYYSLVIELNYSQMSFGKYNKYFEEKFVIVCFQQISGKDRLTQVTTRSHVPKLQHTLYKYLKDELELVHYKMHY